MKTTHSILTVMTATLALSTAVLAADGKTPVPAKASEAADEANVVAVFAKLDADQDQRVSLVESRKSQTLPGAFARLDANHDGFLTPTEFAMWEEAGNLATLAPVDPTTAPSGSSGAQHMPKRD